LPSSPAPSSMTRVACGLNGVPKALSMVPIVAVHSISKPGGYVVLY
jgi:hypothetical protein